MSCILENLRRKTTSANYRIRFISEIFDCKNGKKQMLFQKRRKQFKPQKNKHILLKLFKFIFIVHNFFYNETVKHFQNFPSGILYFSLLPSNRSQYFGASHGTAESRIDFLSPLIWNKKEKYVNYETAHFEIYFAIFKNCLTRNKISIEKNEQKNHQT